MTPPPPSSTAELDVLLSHSAWVRRLALRLVGDPDRAEDLAQETWLAALRHRPDSGPRSAGSLRSWLGTVLRNRVRQDARGAARRSDRELVASRSESNDDSTLDLVERLAVHRRVVEAVTELDEPYRKTILLRYFEGCTPTEIAQRTGAPLSTVKTHLARGLERLRARLDTEYGGRSLWSTALVAFARPSGGASATAVGAVVVSTPLKIAIAAVVVAAGVYVAWPPTVSDAPPIEEDALVVEATTAEVDAPEARGELVAEGSATERVAVPAALETASGTADEELEPSDIAALPLTGTVLDSDAVPVAGVPLRWLSRADWARRSDPDPAYEGATRGRPAESVPDANEVSQAPRTPTERVTRSGSGGRFFFENEGEGFSGASRADRGQVVAAGAEWVTVMAAIVSPTRREAQPIVVVARRRSIAGRVVDDEGYPLEGVRVRTDHPDGFRARFSAVMDFSSEVTNADVTDAHGRFELPDTPGIEGSRVFAHRLGYESLAEPLPASPDDNMLLVLTRPTKPVEGWLEGRVVDIDGRAVPDAHVAFGIEATTTDHDGIFVFDMSAEDSPNQMAARFLEGMQPGRLIAMKPGFLPARIDALPETNGTDGELQWPDDIELVLAGEPLTLAGRVVDDAGEPREGVRVWVADSTLFSLGRGGGIVTESFLAGRGEERWMFAVTDSGGRFELEGLSDRPYRIAAMDTATLFRVETEPIDAGTRNVEVVMGGGDLWRRVRGRVVSRTGAPVPGVSVGPMTDSFRLRYRGQVISTSHSRSDAVVTDDDGVFEIEDVPRDLVYLRLDGEAILPIEYGRHVEGGLRELGGREVEDLTIVVPLRVHLQVTLNDAAMADELALVNDDGEPLEISIMRGNFRDEGRRASIQNGVTDVLSVPDAATTIVLFLAGEEVGRHPVLLTGAGVNRFEL